MAENYEQLGNAIRLARIRRGYTQEHLAELLDITPAHLKHIESERRKPSVPLLFQIMRCLHLSVDELVFPAPSGGQTLSVDGLSPREVEAVRELIELLRAGRD